MKKHILSALILGLTLFSLACVPESGHQTQQLEVLKAHFLSDISAPGTNPNGFEISPGKQVENLQIFMVLGEEELKGAKYITLSEALDKKKVKVKETGSVNELSIDNLSDEYVFIHSGDIVKGGKQDRTIGFDVIVPPNTKNVPLGSFCVEQSRWRKRGGESVSEFGSNTKMLSSRELKMAAKYESNQSQVWGKVAKQQEELSKSITDRNGYQVDVQDKQSATSLQLALENKELESLQNTFRKELKDLPKIYPNAIGYAYAINGEVYGIDVYNNRPLFEKLWDKLLESAIVEAISLKESLDFQPITQSAVLTFMEGIEAGEKTEKKKEVNKTTVLNTRENDSRYVSFSTEDNSQNNWVHKNYMRRTEAEVKQQNQLQNRQIENSRQIQQNRNNNLNDNLNNDLNRNLNQNINLNRIQNLEQRRNDRQERNRDRNQNYP